MRSSRFGGVYADVRVCRSMLAEIQQQLETVVVFDRASCSRVAREVESASWWNETNRHNEQHSPLAQI